MLSFLGSFCTVVLFLESGQAMRAHPTRNSEAFGFGTLSMGPRLRGDDVAPPPRRGLNVT